GAPAATAAAVPAARRAGSSRAVPSPAAPPAAERASCRVPAPRAYEPLRRLRGRTLPPTMKQRINAEAHGSTPRARSLPAGTLLTDDGYGGLMTVPAPADGDRTAPRTGTPASPASGSRTLAALRS